MNVQDWLGENNQLGVDIWTKKYQHNNESFDEWLDRVSGGNENVKQLIREKKFLFGGRILANRGITKDGTKVTYSNCYVTTTDDSIEDIYETCKKLARTYSYGGGVGLDISKLSPKGARVNNAAKTTSGAVSFMDTFSQVTNQIGQMGRRGALMLSIDCKHPDLEDFISIKSDLNKVNYANISVRISDDFMHAVLNNDDWELKFTRKNTGEVISKTVKAKDIFHSIAKGNWDMAEPGMLFWNTIENWNLLANTRNFEYAGVNPCAEEPLPAGGSCLLGSINLAEFVDTDGKIDYVSLADTVSIATIALNEVLDEGLPLHPLEEQRQSVADWRQIGLGVMGIADMLIKMGIRYGSHQSIELCKNISNFILNHALVASARIAQEKGAYKYYNYDCVSFTDFYKQNVVQSVDEIIRQYGLRNSQLLTIAPTGTLSTMIGVSGGVEPIFANSYERKTQSLHGKDVYYKVYTPIVQKYLEEHNLTDDSELPEYFVTAQNLNYLERITMQAAWQHSIDASISSTINVPNSFTVEDVENLYIEAWKHGLKGVTIFRDGCRRAGVLTTNDTKEDSDEKDSNNKPTGLPRGHVINASDNLVGKKRKLITGCGSLHCEAFFDPVTGDLMETFLSKGSSGGCNNFMIGLSRMISLAARAGCNIESIVDQLDSCGTCPSYAVRRATKHDTSKGSCCPMAVGNALLDMWHEMQNEIKDSKEEIYTKEAVLFTNNEPAITINIELCPECGAPLIHEGGCVSCKNCSWSKCN